MMWQESLADTLSQTAAWRPFQGTLALLRAEFAIF